VRTSKDANYLFQQSRQAAHKAREALSRGDLPDTIYLHRENAVRYHAKALAAMRPSSALQ
jgi:hypothetical protein